MVNEIKPIETIFDGYKFRSRLEARWAVFFKDAGIPYEYEPEGITLDNGTGYLPDFYLPWFDCYVEIKAKIPENKDIVLNLVHNFPYAKPLLICVGDPYEDKMLVFYRDEENYPCHFVEGAKWKYEDTLSDLYYEQGYGKHTISILCDTPYLNWGNCIHGFSIRPQEWQYEKIPKSLEKSYIGENITFYTRSHLETSKLKARQARFEHGEKG